MPRYNTHLQADLRESCEVAKILVMIMTVASLVQIDIAP